MAHNQKAYDTIVDIVDQAIKQELGHLSGSYKLGVGDLREILAEALHNTLLELDIIKRDV